MNSDYMFADDDGDSEGKAARVPGWKILSVDDEPEVHDVTKLVLSNFEFEGTHPEIVTANSAREAREYLRNHDDVVLVLLDVVMESDHAGFDVVETIREELKNNKVRIVIRTGQPGDLVMETTMDKYDVDGYVEKSNLTHNYLHTTVYSAFRSYRDAQIIVKNQARQAAFIKKIQSLNLIRDVDLLFEQVAIDLTEILNDIKGLYVIITSEVDENNITRELIPMSKDNENDSSFDRVVSSADEKNSTIQNQDQFLYRHDLNNNEIFKLYIKTQVAIDDEMKALFIAYCANVSTLYELNT